MSELFAEFLQFLRSFWRWFFRPLPVAVTVGLWVVGILVVLMGTVHVTSQSNFCGNCHVMEPYYESWKTSSHNFAECVDCHIPPGVEAAIEKKVEALNMVVSYFTGSYGSNPWAEIDDASCLRCHTEPLDGPVLFGDVLFDHGPHLTEMRRGKQLRCTSCHGQIVQGSHITVTPSTCVLCHFREEPTPPPTAAPVAAGMVPAAAVGITPATETRELDECILCHEVPDRIIEKGALSFDHGDVSRFDMDCAWCHSHVVKGDGRATENRCLICHNDPERLAAFDDTERMHKTHVTDHKVECLHCHTEMRHGTFDGRDEVAGIGCNTCHEGGHSPQRDLFVGIGGRGTEPRPDVMHLAGIRCEGCHTQSKLKGKGAGIVHTANNTSCVACHGAGFDNILDRWLDLEATRLTAARQQLRDAQQRLPADHQALIDAQANIDLVAAGRAVHNINYAQDVLWSNHELLDAALVSAGKDPVGAPWASVPYASDCLRCHQGIELQRGEWQGRPFAHDKHVIGQQVDCLTCHEPHVDGAMHEIVSISAADCATCHHADDDGDLVDRCEQCHVGVIQDVVPVESDYGDLFDHLYHVEEEELACADCHIADVIPAVDTEMCLDCHE